MEPMSYLLRIRLTISLPFDLDLGFEGYLTLELVLPRHLKDKKVGF